jgi:hypothetical protein
VGFAAEAGITGEGHARTRVDALPLGPVQGTEGIHRSRARAGGMMKYQILQKQKIRRYKNTRNTPTKDEGKLPSLT